MKIAGPREQLLVAALYLEKGIGRVDRQVAGNMRELHRAGRKIGEGGIHPHAAADVFQRPAAAAGRAALDRLAFAGLQERQLALEADRVHVRQVVAEHLDLGALGIGTGGRHVKAVVHRSLSVGQAVLPAMIASRTVAKLSVRPTLSKRRAERRAIAFARISR